jgi:Alpha amylase, catalytic domain
VYTRRRKYRTWVGCTSVHSRSGHHRILKTTTNPRLLNFEPSILLHFFEHFYFLSSSKMGSITHHQHRAWWKETSVYQIYPASFKDSNDDGIGDLEGIISKVAYLHKLGVECVWLSPILKSPQVDMGYDISDYKVIDPQYGSLEDVDRLTKELNSRGMKLIMDRSCSRFLFFYPRLSQEQREDLLLLLRLPETGSAD